MGNALDTCGQCDNAIIIMRIYFSEHFAEKNTAILQKRQCVTVILPYLKLSLLFKILPNCDKIAKTHSLK